MAKQLKFYTIISFMLLIACDSNQSSISELEFLGAVSAATPEATKAGEDILLKGGNAIDAAVAISFVLGVTEPAMSGLGGGTQMLVGLKDRDPFMINGSTFSPKATPTDWNKRALTYHKRSTIPSTVKTTYYSWKKYGSGKLTWEELLTPSIKYAEEGFVVGEFRNKVYQRYEERLKDSPHQSNFLLMPNGNIPAKGDTLKQPILAETLKKIAKGGEEIFYKGEIAEKISQDMIANQGWISLEDLNQFPDPVEIPALKTNYHGHEVYTSAPPCGGWIMLLALNAIEVLESDHYPDSLQTEYAIIKALEMAHNDRLLHPITSHLDYTDEINLKIDKNYPREIIQSRAVRKNNDDGGETTHFSVVDKDGVVVAVTASINAYFGARAASPELGFMYNTYMDDFEFGDPEHPWAIGPGKMAYSSMTPTIVRFDGENVMALGSPGSARIISAVAQVIRHWIDEGENLKEAVDAPRYHVNRDRLYIENVADRQRLYALMNNLNLRFRSVPDDLEKEGLNAYFGGVHAVARQSGKWISVADPRRDGTATSSQK